MPLKLHRNSSEGGIRFRRILSFEWKEPIKICSEADLIGEDGDVDRAIVFGHHSSVGKKEPIQIDGINFTSFQERRKIDTLTATSGKGRVVHGPFFGPASKNDKFKNLSNEVMSLLSLGAWVPTLPKDEELVLSIGELVEDVEYEIRIIVADNRRDGPHPLLISPGEITIVPNGADEIGQVAIGRFVAHSDRASIRIKALSDRQPSISALVLRRVGVKKKVFSKVKFVKNDA